MDMGCYVPWMTCYLITMSRMEGRVTMMENNDEMEVDQEPIPLG